MYSHIETIFQSGNIQKCLTTGFVEPVVVESDDVHDPGTLKGRRRHRFTNERIVVMAEGTTVRFIWRAHPEASSANI
jgi:hypothetical protein